MQRFSGGVGAGREGTVSTGSGYSPPSYRPPPKRGASLFSQVAAWVGRTGAAVALITSGKSHPGNFSTHDVSPRASVDSMSDQPGGLEGGKGALAPDSGPTLGPASHYLR